MPRASGNRFVRPNNENAPVSPPHDYPASSMFSPALNTSTTMSGAQPSPNPWATFGGMDSFNEAAMGQTGPGAFSRPVLGSVTMGAATNHTANPQMQVPFEGFGSQFYLSPINYDPRITFTEAPITRAACYPCRWLACTKVFQRNSDLIRHVNSLHLSPGSYICPQCGHICNRKDNLKSHLQNMHGMQLQESHAAMSQI
ncbi:hypothetical protein BO94DRAFT_579153 [Aspergillus sclerotioniger CBS 115572]|uniref:C2H2-type domain-containing protein n=1 Tax=Aspergillus sclerotioniger CBS 115572 TaxID=1450535 RepID=A0A317V5S7_9EURO|nr:hypothetical protein BO94DRAFT_579153 [Aspergillus sclerotioniger CBS 115572]PWY69664.1 hypothetical protein BO94DRAFT_579153 [Aspergillus sclerotioniger CBS 115572]